MAKSARASRIKKNKQALKKKVFGPAEAARSERLSAKLLDLATQPKPTPDSQMDDSREAPTSDSQQEPDPIAQEDEGKTQPFDAPFEDPASKREGKQRATPSVGSALQRRIAARQTRVEKSRHRRERNRLTFATHPKKKLHQRQKGGKKR